LVQRGSEVVRAQTGVSVPQKSEPHVQLSKSIQLSSRERPTLVVSNTLADRGTRVYWTLVEDRRAPVLLDLCGGQMGGATGEPGRLVRVMVRVQMAGKIEGENNHYGYSDGDGVIAPIPAVRPNWKTSYKRYDYHHRENE
jgi:hypothetical protein